MSKFYVSGCKKLSPCHIIVFISLKNETTPCIATSFIGGEWCGVFSVIDPARNDCITALIKKYRRELFNIISG